MVQYRRTTLTVFVAKHVPESQKLVLKSYYHLIKYSVNLILLGTLEEKGTYCVETREQVWL